MLKRYLISFLFICSLFYSFSQLNLDSISNLNYQNLHGTLLNDIWGYTDEFGNEYGLIGAETGVSIVDVSNPNNPTEVAWIPGAHSIWRDLKTFGDYAYVTTEASSGLLIIDLSPLPSGPVTTSIYYNGPLGQQWSSAHNIFIDDNGYAYIFGANRGNQGVIILDVFTDPMNPIEVGVFDDWYVHDGFVRNDTLFSGHIYQGFFSMVDVSDKANPVLLGTQNSPSTFCHNIWTSSDGLYAFTTDEVSGGYIAAFDISDPTNIVELDRIKSSPEYGAVIPHNTHVKDGFLVTSYYSDGVVVHDATYPYNLVEVANYDTYPGQTDYYDGCWGVYPFFASGIILASDRSEGLFVLSPNYTQACYLEGVVRNSQTNALMNGVSVRIENTPIEDGTNSNGFYATGVATNGIYDVTFFKVGFYPKTFSLALTNGVVLNQDVYLEPIPSYNLKIRVFEEETKHPILGADILLKSLLTTDYGATNGLGEEDFVLYYQEWYELVVGKWGRKIICKNEFIDNNTGILDVYLPEGYYDDFTFDFGWSVSGNAVTGMWERAKPSGLEGVSVPVEDVLNDCGEMAYLTENKTQSLPRYFDVGSGNTHLTSPVFDLSGYEDPYLQYARWFFNDFGPAFIDDTLRIVISNGTDIVELDKVGKDTTSWNVWVDKSYRIADFISLSSTMQLFVKTSDDDTNPNITEAGFDNFRIVEANDLFPGYGSELIVFPNPSQGIFEVKGIFIPTSFQVYDLKGKLILDGVVTPTENKVNLTNTQQGLYFMVINNEVFKLIKR